MYNGCGRLGRNFPAALPLKAKSEALGVTGHAQIDPEINEKKIARGVFVEYILSILWLPPGWVAPNRTQRARFE
jgi:hypothetical protein